MKLGINNIAKYYVGSNQVDKIYKGVNQVYTKAPFLANDFTYWFDFNSGSNVYDDFAFDSLSYAPNLVSGYRFFEQPVKDYQPFKLSDGINFGNTTDIADRFMELYPLPGFTENKTGLFFACNIFTSGNGTLLSLNTFEIRGARGKFSLNGLKPQISMSPNGADTGAITVIKLATNALAADTWYTLGFLIDRENDIAKIYVNGNVVDTSTVSAPYTSTATFPLKQVILGADGIEGASGSKFDGVLSEMIIQDSLELAYITNQLAYLQSTRLDIPDAPVITATTANNSAIISFTAPNAHNKAITDYSYQYKLNSSGTWLDFTDSVSSTAGITITGLTNDLLYNFRVKATNVIGVGLWSNIAETTPTANPGPPDAIDDLQVVSGSNSLLVLWTAPNVNGYPITTHKVYYRIAGSGNAYTLFANIPAGSGTLQTLITSLTNNVSYEVNVTSVNSQGESAEATPTVAETPVTARNLQTVSGLESCVMDIDLTVLASYNGTGTVLKNLVTSPADGSGQTAYNMQFGDGSLATTFPVFSGIAGTASGKITFDGGDHLTLVGANTTFLNNIHKSSGGSAFTIVAFFEAIKDGASSQILFTTKNGSNEVGIDGYVSSSEVLRMGQRGGTTNVTSPTTAATAVLNTPTYIGFGCNVNGGTNTCAFWSDSTTQANSTLNYNSTTTNAAQKLHMMGQGSGTGAATGRFVNNTVLKAVALFNTRLSNSQMALVVAEYNARHGNIY
jgi:hypothetical protein